MRTTTSFRDYVIARRVTDTPEGDFVSDMRAATDFPEVDTFEELRQAIFTFQRRSADGRRWSRVGGIFYPFVCSGMGVLEAAEYHWKKFQKMTCPPVVPRS